MSDGRYSEEPDFATAAEAWLSMESFTLAREYRDKFNALAVEFHERLAAELAAAPAVEERCMVRHGMTYCNLAVGHATPHEYDPAVEEQG